MMLTPCSPIWLSPARVISLRTTSLGAIPIAPPVSSTITILDDDSGIIAESSLIPTIDSDGVAVAEIMIERFKFQGGDLSFIPRGGVQSFSATLAFDTDLVEIIGVRSVTEIAGNTIFDSTSTPGQLTISGSTTTPATTTPLVMAKIVVRLIGSNASSTQFTILHDGVDGDSMDEADGLYINQFVVELRGVFFDLID